jgi:RNA polymerase sigma-70 factor (ECF subfamily)
MSPTLKRQTVTQPASERKDSARQTGDREAYIVKTGERGASRQGLAELQAPLQTRPDMEKQLPPVPEDPVPGDHAGDPAASHDWTATVDRIRAGDPLAMTELYAVFTRGIRYLLLRSLGVEEVDDRVHDCFLIVAEAIRSGELRDPARLMGYVRTVVRRHIAASIEDAINRRRTTVEFEDSVFSVSDWKNNPEQNLLARQRAEIARRVFRGVSGRDREILRRFYLLEQPQELICREMGLSYNQFRLLKSRAKARFGKLGQSLAESGTLGLAAVGGQNPSGDKKSEKISGAGH